MKCRKCGCVEFQESKSKKSSRINLDVMAASKDCGVKVQKLVMDSYTSCKEAYLNLFSHSRSVVAHFNISVCRFCEKSFSSSCISSLFQNHSAAICTATFSWINVDKSGCHRRIKANFSAFAFPHGPQSGVLQVCIPEKVWSDPVHNEGLNFLYTSHIMPSESHRDLSLSSKIDDSPCTSCGTSTPSSIASPQSLSDSSFSSKWSSPISPLSLHLEDSPSTTGLMSKTVSRDFPDNLTTSPFSDSQESRTIWRFENDATSNFGSTLYEDAPSSFYVSATGLWESDEGTANKESGAVESSMEFKRDSPIFAHVMNSVQKASFPMDLGINRNSFTECVEKCHKSPVQSVKEPISNICNSLMMEEEVSQLLANYSLKSLGNGEIEWKEWESLQFRVKKIVFRAIISRDISVAMAAKAIVTILMSGKNFWTKFRKLCQTLTKFSELSRKVYEDVHPKIWCCHLLLHLFLFVASLSNSSLHWEGHSKTQALFESSISEADDVLIHHLMPKDSLPKYVSSSLQRILLWLKSNGCTSEVQNFMRGYRTNESNDDSWDKMNEISTKVASVWFSHLLSKYFTPNATMRRILFELASSCSLERVLPFDIEEIPTSAKDMAMATKQSMMAPEDPSIKISTIFDRSAKFVPSWNVDKEPLLLSKDTASSDSLNRSPFESNKNNTSKILGQRRINEAQRVTSLDTKNEISGNVISSVRTPSPTVAVNPLLGKKRSTRVDHRIDMGSKKQVIYSSSIGKDRKSLTMIQDPKMSRMDSNASSSMNLLNRLEGSIFDASSRRGSSIISSPVRAPKRKRIDDTPTRTTTIPRRRLSLEQCSNDNKEWSFVNEINNETNEIFSTSRDISTAPSVATSSITTLTSTSTSTSSLSSSSSSGFTSIFPKDVRRNLF